jgi:hypothetical protein
MPPEMSLVSSPTCVRRRAAAAPATIADKAAVTANLTHTPINVPALPSSPPRRAEDRHAVFSEIRLPRIDTRRKASPVAYSYLHKSDPNAAELRLIRYGAMPHRRLAQNRWMRSQACCSDGVAVA